MYNILEINGTYILIATATDDTRVVAIGNMGELEELIGVENEMRPIYVIE